MLQFFLLLTAIIVLVIVGIGLGMRFILNRTIAGIENKHMAAEYIVDRGLVPEHWVEELYEDSKNEKEEARKKAIKRVDKLKKHFKTSSLVENEEVREELMSQLEEAKKDWQKKEWEEIIPDIYS